MKHKKINEQHVLRLNVARKNVLIMYLVNHGMKLDIIIFLSQHMWQNVYIDFYLMVWTVIKYIVVNNFIIL